MATKEVGKGAMVYAPIMFGVGVVQGVEDGQALVIFEDGDCRLFASYPVEEVRPVVQDYKPFKIKPFRIVADKLSVYVHESGVMDLSAEVMPQIAILPRDAYAFEGGVKIIGE